MGDPKMIEAPTVDYDRVHSSTATEDGERIVLTLATEEGTTNISLPSNQVPRLITAASTAAGMAKRAQGLKRTSLAFGVQNIEIRVQDACTEVLLVIELAGGAELVFQTNNERLAQFLDECESGLKSIRQSGRSIQ
jgi:hypothetical protein